MGAGLEKALQRVAAGMDGGAKPMVRHRTGSITAYTAGTLTASVQVGQDTIDAPFLNPYTPTVGDTVSVLINNGSPLILGAVNKLPASAGVIAAGADYQQSPQPTWTLVTGNYHANFDNTVLSDGFDDYAAHFEPVLGTGGHDGVTNLLTPGWYQAAAKAKLTGATAGEEISMTLAHPGLDDASLDWGVVSSAGNCYLYATSIPFPVTQDDIDAFLAYVQVWASSASGTGTLSNCKLAIVKFDGAAPAVTY